MSARSATPISTPDRRVRVFVSSTLQEVAEERRAVKAAILEMRLTPVMFELGARPHPPRELYRAYLAQSDVFVGIYWQRYGWVAPGETVSGLEDEYLLSGERPKLIYVKESHDREPRLDDLLDRVRADDRAAYKPFTDAAELSDLLADDLAVLLTERFTAAPEPPAPAGLRAARLPLPPTALVGRDAEVAAIRSVLLEEGERLVTLVGPGGIGKTRLALEVAYELEHSFDGAWFVDLSPLSDAGQVAGTIADALGVRAEGSRPVLDVVADRLGDRRVLLVLDNFEQVLLAAADVAALLTACPNLVVLVTTRTVLRLRGEREIPLAPLETPVAADLASIEQAAAVELFVARARDVRPSFALTAGNAGAVAELCRRLDGIPLAIELAAAQLRLLSPAALLRRLGASLDLPTAGPVDLPNRQRTLRATVEWSHSLLSPDEKILLARLSAFAGSFTLDAADAVGTDEVDVLSVLSSLVAQSLVVPRDQDAEEPRFRMLDTVRAYARERLEERGERAETEQRLVAWLRGFAEEAGEGMAGPDNGLWARRVDRQLPDIDAAIRWAVRADDAASAVRLTGPLYSYWWRNGRLGAMRSIAEEVAALPSAAALPPDVAAQLTWGRGMFRIAGGDVADAEPFLRTLMAAADDLGYGRLRAHALTGLGLVSTASDPAAALTLMDEAVGIFRGLGDDWGLAFALSGRGQVALLTGDPAGATAAHTEALGAAERMDNDHLRAQILDLLGLDAFAVGDVAGARERFAGAAEVHIRLGDQEGSAYCLEGLAGIAMAQGKVPVAAMLLGAAAHAREVVGVAVWPAMRPLSDAFAAGVAAAAGEPAYGRARAEGARMRAADALAYALEQTS